MAGPHNDNAVILQQHGDSLAAYPGGLHSAPLLAQPASVFTTNAVFRASTSLESVISTLELSRRPRRSSDHTSESRALIALREAMTATSSDRILQNYWWNSRRTCAARTRPRSVSRRASA